MSQDRTIQELFDSLLSDNLQRPVAHNSDFTQKVVHKMQRLYAQRMLRKVLLQKRIAAGLIAMTVLSVIGLSCCPPASTYIYFVFKSAFVHAIRCLIESQAPDLFVLVAVLLPLGLLLKTLWNDLTSDY